ncbi:FG-GAP-like repeat-containing protein [Geothermobacter ehrlichii]|nr:FG-GAP-like repeat-containing protein [Geothermobacter ehrlichii]
MPTVTYLETFGVGSQMAGPGAIDLDDSGNLYIADHDAGVLKFSKLGSLEGRFNAAPVSGAGLAVTPDGSRIYVVGDSDGDFTSDQVAILDGRTGAVLGYLGRGAGEFAGAGEIDLDSSGMIYVLDASAKTVRFYQDSGSGNAVLAGSFSVDVSGRLCALSAMVINPVTDEIFVADKKAPGEVRVYSPQGGLLVTYAAAADFGAQMLSFRGMAFDGQGRGYFIDNISARIAVLDFAAAASGGKAPVLGSIDLTSLVSGATLPQDVVMDGLGRLFVSGSYADGPSAAVLGIGNYQVPSNTAPPSPSILSPMDGSVVASATPVLNYSAVTDADGDPVTYDVSVACDGVQVEVGAGLPAGGYQVQTALPENAGCVWTVKAFDGVDYSAEASATFFVNAVAEAPSAPVLQSPADQAGDVVGASLFVWAASTDPDPNDSVGYLLQIVDAAGNVLAAVDAVSGIALNQTPAYDAMVPGGVYSWAVTAVDATGSEAVSATQSFTFAETGLVIDSNVPGADVYLGGNPGYLGRKVGQTPYVQLGAPAGDYQVAVVHRGFEPVYGMVTLESGGSAHFVADLRPSKEAVGHFQRSHGIRALAADGTYQDIRFNGILMPWIADVDGDGRLDLLVGKRGRKIAYYPALQITDTGGYLRLGDKEVLAELLQRDLAPCVADWNNDGLADLVYGARDGLVRLVLNSGVPGMPVFDGAAAVELTAGGEMITAGGHSAPVVVDWNGDNLKDLLVGGDNGRVELYLNVGSDEAPVLQFEKVLFAARKPKRVVPFPTDWDADGDLDLLVAKNKKVFLLENAGSGLAPQQRVVVFAADKRTMGYFQQGSGLFVVDADDRKGKDILAADGNGVLRFAKARGSEPVAAFFDVLVQKLDQVADMITNDSGDPTLLAMVDQAKTSASAGDLAALPSAISSLRNAQGLPAEAAATCDELMGLLP